MTVPYTFANATSAIPLSQLDSNFASPVTIGNVAIQLGNTVSAIGNVTLNSATLNNSTAANVTISSVSTPITAAQGGTGNSSAFTANAVIYAPTTSTLATGSALVFDGTNLSLGVSGTGGSRFKWVTDASANGRSWGITNGYTNAGDMVILSSSTNNDTLNTQQVQIQRNGTFVWTPAGTEQMRLSSSGNLGIGQTSPSYRLDVVNATGSGATTSIRLNNPGTAAGDGPQILFTSGTSTTGGCAIAGYGTALNAADMVFYSGGNTERMRLDSSGRLLVGVTSYSDGSLFKTDSGNTALNAYRASSSTSSGIFAVYSDVGGTQTIRAYLRLDGGLANYSANNLNLSDERLKKNITPASDYLAKICAIPVKTFLYKDQAETEDLTLGVIAQDVQSIAPELVSKSGFGVNDENKLDYLSIYQTDLQYALMKSIQELSALVTAQSATITSLTDRITALEAK